MFYDGDFFRFLYPVKNQLSCTCVVSGALGHQ